VLLKASPLLDIQQGLRELPHTKIVMALSVENEMKELLFLAQRDFNERLRYQQLILIERRDKIKVYIYTSPGSSSPTRLQRTTSLSVRTRSSTIESRSV
jgi:hypothetical protein